MSEKALNSVIKSTSDNEILDSMVNSESSLKRTFTLPFRVKKKQENVKIEEIERPLMRHSSIRKVIKRFVSLWSEKTDLDPLRRTSQNDIRIPPFKFLPGDKVPGVTGLRNHGNTCFINAVLQCLTHTDPFAEFFVMNKHKDVINRRSKLTSKKYGTKGEVTEQLATLLKAMWHCQYEPEVSSQLKAVVEKHGTQYRGGSQHDAQEFLIWLLDKVHEDLNTATKKTYRPNKSSFDRPDDEVARETLANHVRCNSSFVHKVFQAQFRSSLTCLNCKRQSNTFDPFLCLSVPVPQQQKRPIYVTVLYISQQPRQVKLGLSLPVAGTVKDLREQLSSDTGIADNLMLLTQIDDLGFQHNLSWQQPLCELREMDPIYCMEMPCVKETDDLEKCLILCWVNVTILDDHCSRFGSPYIMQLCRLTDYKDLQKLILKEMNMIVHDDVLTTDQEIPLFRIKIVDGINSIEAPATHLDPTVDHPLFMEEVDQAMALQDDCGPPHLKLILEWDIQTKESTISDDRDVVEELLSVKATQSVTETAGSVTLEECLDVYTRAELLGAEDKWHCPFCNRKQQVIKKLGLWSLPDVLVVHLKRFRQTSKNRSATKITTLVDCPLHGLDMSGHKVGPTREVVLTTQRRPRPGKVTKLRSGDDIYDLYAVCNHHGADVQGGHYTAYCRNPFDQEWYLFDDTKTEPVAETAVITPAAYILFYLRRSANTSTGADHWVHKMPMFRLPRSSNTTEDTKNTNTCDKDVKSPQPPTSITSPRPQRKATPEEPESTEKSPKSETITCVAQVETQPAESIQESAKETTPNKSSISVCTITPITETACLAVLEESLV